MTVSSAANPDKTTAIRQIAGGQSAPTSVPQQVKGFCSICVSRCGTINTVTGGLLVNVQADPSHPNGKAVCMKGRAAPELVHNPNRLLFPMRRTRPKGSEDAGWEQLSWDQALEEVAAKLHCFREEGGPESVVVGSTTPSGSMMDSFEWVKRFAQMFGTPNLLGTTEICNWHKDDANEFTFGCATPPGDHRNADVILLWGNNPANTWLAQAEAIGHGRSKGAKLIVVDPRKTALAREATLWLRVRPGTDDALAMGIANAIVTTGNMDETFVRRWTNAPLLVRADTGFFLRERDIDPGSTENRYAVWDKRQSQVDFTGARAGDETVDVDLSGTHGITVLDPVDACKIVKCQPVFAAYAEALKPYSPSRTEEITGVPAKDVLRAAELLGPGQRISHFAWSGVGQNTNATQTARAIATLYALTGSFDQKGANWRFTTHPVNKIEDYVSNVPAIQRAKTLGLTERPLGPALKGTVNIASLCRAVLEEDPYKIRGLVTFGLAPHTSYIDMDRVGEALSRLEFHVHCDLFETPAARHADILLPACSFAEREALRVGFDISEQAVEHVQLGPRIVPPRGESRADYDIVMDLALRLGLGAQFFGGSIEAGWDHILAPLGLDAAALRRIPGGNPAALGSKGTQICASRFPGLPGRVFDRNSACRDLLGEAAAPWLSRVADMHAPEDGCVWSGQD